MTFAQLNLSPALVQVAQELGFTQPTAIQTQSIPLLLQGKDLIAQSQTGSGKTAAFSLPILQNLSLQGRRVQALILCPTRELCAQVAREIRRLGRRHPGLQVLTITGGAPIFSQLNALSKGVHLVVGTPGRVMDHLRRGSLDLSSVSTVVLDEADRMLEMGFQEDMEDILSQVPESRQTVLFSATFPQNVEGLSRKYQRTPERITIERSNQTVAAIQQVLVEVEPENRLKALLKIIEQKQPESMIIFCNFKASVNELMESLSQSGLSVGALHGDLEQYDRDRIMAKFRNKSLKALVATDVAARGIDIESLDAVVNFELPSQPEVYVHRVGRTGRAGREGFAVSFITAREKTKVRAIEQFASVRFEKLDLGSLKDVDPQTIQEQIQGAAEMRTLYISGGRKEKVRPGDILGALTGEAGRLSAADVGKIEIHDHFSYVAVSAHLADTALERLRNGRIKGRKFKVEAVR
jgi:ATP-independent RNA helicase DbpA